MTVMDFRSRGSIVEKYASLRLNPTLADEVVVRGARGRGARLMPNVP